MLPALGVERADILRSRFLSVAAIAGSPGIAGDHDDITDDEWTGAVGEASGERMVLKVQARAAQVAKAGHQRAGFRIDRVEILAANREDPALDVPCAAAPVVYAARGVPVGLLPCRRHGLLFPNRPAGFAVDRDHQAVRVLRVEHSVDHDRRRPQVGGRPQVGERLHELVADRGPSPDDLQVLDVVAVDLIERRVPGVALVAAEVPPLGSGRLRLGRSDQGGRRHQAENQASPDHQPLDRSHRSPLCTDVRQMRHPTGARRCRQPI